MATLTATQPTVTFNFDTRTITMTVITTPGSGVNEFNIDAAPVSIPLHTWSLIWELISEGEQQAAFNSIVFPNPPLPSGNVTISNSQGGGSQWTATLENEVGSFNGFNYTIIVEPAAWPGPGSPPTSSEDPSIAVTPDPPPPSV